MAYAFKVFTPWNQVKSWDKSNDRDRNPDEPFSDDFLLPGKLQSEFETTSHTVPVTWITLKKKKKRGRTETSGVFKLFSKFSISRIFTLAASSNSQQEIWQKALYT